MLGTLTLLVTVTTGASWACDGGDGSCEHHEARRPDASAAASGRLMGSSCSVTTANMAQRVIEQGRVWTYLGRLQASEEQLRSHVAVPFTAGPDVHVVANEVVEALLEGQPDLGRVSLRGYLLEVDGVKYAVVTGHGPES